MSPLSCMELYCERRDWPHGPVWVRNVTVAFQAGQIYGICGENGRELLLHLLGLLDRPDSGTISVFGKEMNSLNPETCTQERNRLFGYLLRRPCLLPSFSVAENIAMPLLRIRSVSAEEAAHRTRSMLELCGLSHLAELPVVQLDAATQQQIALLRALIHQPKILIAISPLPSATVLTFARLAAHEMGMTVICSGEDEHFLATHCDRLFVVKNGFLSGK